MQIQRNKNKLKNKNKPCENTMNMTLDMTTIKHE